MRSVEPDLGSAGVKGHSIEGVCWDALKFLIMHLCFSDCLLSFSFIVWVRMTLPMCLSFDVCV